MLAIMPSRSCGREAIYWGITGPPGKMQRDEMGTFHRDSWNPTHAQKTRMNGAPGLTLAISLLFLNNQETRLLFRCGYWDHGRRASLPSGGRLKKSRMYVEKSWEERGQGARGC